ncbi:MAG: hypothetical protein K2I52_01435, partial [Muribaculaceae bacterium]|nr:hypothetical protein [Muribaculaceae bacterium]
TIYYPDGNSRSVKTEYLNRGSQVRHTPGFEFDTTRVTPSTISHRPMGVHISCGDESLTSLTLSSWMSTDMRLRDAAYDRFTRTKPEVEKLVFRTAEGADSVHRRYGYRYGINFRIFLDRISLEAGTYIDGDTAVISRRLYTDYDRHYRPLSIVDEQGRGIDLTWMELYDHMTSMTYRDADLATSYTYKPFTGCTGITYPSGQTRRYGYKAGRLTRISNTYGETLQEYSYKFYNDGTGRNIIRHKTYNTTKKKPYTNTGPMRTSVMIWPTDTTTVNEDSVWEEDDGYEEECEDCDIVTSAGKTVYYDGFGMPVQTVTTVAGGSLIRSAVDYDAVDRPIRQYLPTAAYDENYMEEISDQSVSYYGDSYPFTQVKYREMSGDQPLQVLKEGKAMQEHPLLYEYLCNSVTDTQLRCRRYRLSGGRDSETVTLDGCYPAGALDVTRQTDPDGCTLLTFTDWRGLRILERRPVDNDTYADTYYLYDVMGNVRVILQPEAVVRMTRDSSTWTDRDEVLDKLAFINRYDRRGNCIYAKVPGAGAVRMRYDRYNRLAYRQTTVMRERGEAEFILYDPIGRVAVCGITILL